jgi:hypothetical protein
VIAYLRQIVRGNGCVVRIRTREQSESLDRTPAHVLILVGQSFRQSLARCREPLGVRTADYHQRRTQVMNDEIILLE